MSTEGDTTCKLIQIKNSLLNLLKRRLQPSQLQEVIHHVSKLPISKDTSTNLVPQLRDAETIEEVLDLIEPFIRFNRHEILTHLFAKFGDKDEDEEDVKNYKELVDKFNRETTVEELIELMKQSQHRGDKSYIKKAKDEGATITMVLQDSYKNKTLNQLEENILAIFECENYVLMLAEAESGSVNIMWYTGVAAIPYLTEKAKKNKQKFKKMGVISLIVGHEIIQKGFVSPSGGMVLTVQKQPSYSSISLEPKDTPSEEEVNIDVHLYDSLLQYIIRRDVSQLTEILSQAPIDQLTSIFKQKNDHGQCILHNAVNSQNVQIVKAFLKYIDHTDNNNLRWLRDKDEVCPLLLAMKSKMLDIFEAILSYPNHLTIPPEYPNLLKLAMSDQDHSMELLKIILDHSKGNPSLLYSDFSMHFPSVDIPKSLKLEHTIPIIVVGDADAGKSTFIKSLQVQGIKSQFYHLFVNVHNVGQHKAGVIPTQFDSTWFGKVVFYDLSAHREFVHEAILHCGFLADAVFVIVFDLHDETNDIIRKLIYWFNFIHYYHKKVSKQDFHLPNVIIVGSHLHIHRLGRITNWDNFYYRCYPKVLQKIPRDEFNIITKSLMDCRKSSGENARLRFAMLAEFERLRANRSQIPSKSYLLYSIVQKHCTRSSNPSMTFSDVLDLLRNMDNSLLCNVITPTVEEILHLCAPLKEYNLLVVLKNQEELEQSWIVYDTAPLLAKVEEIIFNGDNHPDGGIMTRDTLQGLFEPHHPINPNMMISLMTYYCYCEKIRSVQSQSPTNSLNQERFFFPHLLPRELQIESHDELMFAWSVSPESQFHHLMPCFVHHFLLHLSQDPHIVGDAQRYNRSRHSIETSFASVGLSMVIHVDSNRDIVVSMKSESNNEDNLIKCLEKRNFLIRKIKETMTIIEPNIWSNLSLVETLISGHHPRRRVTYPILDQSYVKGGIDQRYKVSDLGLAVLHREHNVQPISAPEPLSTVNNLLLFEPYFFMSDEQRKILYDLETPDEIISYDFFEGLGHVLKQENIFLLLAAVGIDPVDISAIKNSSNQHGYQPVLTKSFAHVQGKGVTYKQLRDMLDSISFFKLDDLLSLVPPPSPFFVTT